MKLSDNAQAALDTVVQRFKAGDLSPIVELAAIAPDPSNIVPFDKWSFSNQIMAYLQTGTTDCRGFRQWQDAGRQVRKGERAAYILGPITVKKEDPKTGEDVLRCVGFKGIAVFADHQTDGDALPDRNLTPADLPPLYDVAQELGIAVRWAPKMGSAWGSASTDGARVLLSSYDAPVFFHELAHSIHSRIDGRLKGGQHADQETVAELTAAVLSQLYGVDWSGNAWTYISSYNSTDPLAAITAALGTVGQVLAFLETVTV